MVSNQQLHLITPIIINLFYFLVLDIKPQPPNFENIRKHLIETNDIPGMLKCLKLWSDKNN